MSSHLLGRDLTQYLHSSGNGRIRANSSNVLQLANKCGGYAELAAGTYTLPTLDSGQSSFWFLLGATGSVTLTGVGTFASNDIAFVAQQPDGAWAGIVLASSGAASGAAGISIADAHSVIVGTNVETALQEIAAQGKPVSITTYNNTDATGTLTAAAIVGGVIRRTGETTAATDTTDTAAAIIAAWGIDSVAPSAYLASRYFMIRNTVAFPLTIAGGTGVTISGTGMSVVPPNSVGLFLMTADDVDTITITGLGSFRQADLKYAQWATSSAASPVTVAASILEGSMHCGWVNTTNGAVQLNTRTAAQIIAAIPNAHVGFTWIVEIGSRGDNTVTLTAGDGNVTVTNGAVATGTSRRFVCTIATASTVTMQGI